MPMSDEFKNKNQISDSNFKQHSKLSILSYSLGDFIFQIFAITFGAYVFYYYEVELGLNSWLTMKMGPPISLDNIFNISIYFMLYITIFSSNSKSCSKSNWFISLVNICNLFI